MPRQASPSPHHHTTALHWHPPIHSRSMSVSRFRLALPSHSLPHSHPFFTAVLGATEAARSPTHVQYSFYGHQLTVYEAGAAFRPQEHRNDVDAHSVPVPHFGVVLAEGDWHALSQRLREAGTEFIVEPHLRFKGEVGEQWTMFFRDPSGNNLEFKAMTHPEYLFAA